MLPQICFPVDNCGELTILHAEFLIYEFTEESVFEFMNSIY